MREITDQERKRQNLLRKEFDRFIDERFPILADFAERLELHDHSMIVIDPERYLASIDAFMKNQTVNPEDRVWILTRLGYFIGELLIQHFGGIWFLNEIPDSRYFLRYVVGRFAAIKNRDAMVDPFYVADVFLSEPPGRSLISIVHQLEKELLSTNITN